MNRKKSEQPIIRKVCPADHPSILVMNTMSVELLSPLNSKRLNELLELSALSIVIELADEIVGFMLTFAANTAYDSINYSYFNDRFDQFLYIDRVVIDENHRGQRLASSLYEYAYKWAKQHSINTFFAEIDLEPPNAESLSFHKKRGFFEIDTLQHGVKKTVSLQQANVF